MNPLVGSAVTVEHVDGAAAAHVVAVVSVGVVAVPALELGVEFVGLVEALTVECGPVELLEGGALEAFADGVVVWRAGRDPVVRDAGSRRVFARSLRAKNPMVATRSGGSRYVREFQTLARASQAAALSEFFQWNRRRSGSIRLPASSRRESECCGASRTRAQPRLRR